MRVRHAEQALQGVYALNPAHQAGLDIVSYRLSRIRHLLWNGYHGEARRELFGLQHLASETVYLNGESLRAPVTRFIGRCDDLRSYLGNNETALIDYGSRYRADQPVSTSRAEGCVDEIANASMAKRPRMRWSPRRTQLGHSSRRRARWTPHIRKPTRGGETALVFSTPLGTKFRGFLHGAWLRLSSDMERNRINLDRNSL